ncbi:MULTISPECIES: hypothetical protein [unclassified Bradyrhizobium]|uniref:glucosamine inositolphosphorylceramide transferase family protein n=1 Tax=unclassified Bradyrhizobium TaxID=2631580 RepID=UPI00247A7BA0|nr:MULTISPECIES: hypothetical protein [unclassified Bradyrhizobium]WGR70595.1 hypothetical protein MTX24_35615 [Bradyrhizobium sp. ISRA426]WGR75432.1 hypothetical protein MTX21_20715 [Bradyrhizobium sp. ISRA430]WGR85835.1 hypothetical protein MTX25_35300 [Bradyrhizobium sp. ISRA432]
MRVEAHLEELDLVKMTSILGKPWPDIANSAYSLIINLSEAPILAASTPILEPRFDESADSISLFVSLLNRKSPYLSICLARKVEPTVASYLAIENRAELTRGLQLCFARLLALTERAIYHLSKGTQPAVPSRPASADQTFSKVLVLRFAFRFFLAKALDFVLGGLKRREHWSVGLLWSDKWEIPNGIPLHKFITVLDDRRRYYADPFVFSSEGQKWLFVEEFNYQTGKGIISCMPVSTGHKQTTPQPTLVRPYHLSYPFVFRHDEVIYMLPETGGNRTVELYRARSFPFDWVLHQVLIRDVDVYDATLLRHQERWWIFAAIAHRDGSSQDELGIFYSEHLEGPWRAHELNPVKSDCRSSRPAGQFVIYGDRLLRPAQDCESGYGSALVWLEIEELTTDRFKEREIARWPGNAALADGIHTVNFDQELGAIDRRQAVWKFPFFWSSR